MIMVRGMDFVPSLSYNKAYYIKEIWLGVTSREKYRL